MDVLNGLWRPDLRVGPLRPQTFKLALCGHVAERQTLAAGFVGILCVIVAQGLLDFQGEGVLPFNPVGIIGIHGAQHLAQAGQCSSRAPTCQAVGLADQVMSTLQQWAQTVFRRKQRFHLGWMVIELKFLRLWHDS